MRDRARTADSDCLYRISRYDAIRRVLADICGDDGVGAGGLSAVPLFSLFGALQSCLSYGRIIALTRVSNYFFVQAVPT